MNRLGIVAIALILIAVISAGCAKKQTYIAPGGKVTVSEKQGKAKKVEVQTADGKATIEVAKKKITEKELGVPVYTGAKVETAGSYEGSNKGQSEKMHNCMLTTSDDFEKVYEFYKSNLKNVKNSFNQNTDGNKMAVFSVAGDNGEEIAVNISTDKEKKITRIQVVRVQK
ncbi:hypothetical protein LLG46_14020 [bacterium]|nr:hypothetical protein [bacterium]